MVDFITRKDVKRFQRELDYSLPWDRVFNPHPNYYFGDEVLQFILDRVPVGSTVLELGGGKSTSELVKHYTVYTVEDNEDYLDMEPKANYIYARLTPYYDKQLCCGSYWYDRNVLKEKLEGLSYDLLIVDGPEVPESPIGRYGVGRYFGLFKKEVPVLIDDLQSPPIFLTAIKMCRVKKAKHIDINITEENRVFGWIDG